MLHMGYDIDVFHQVRIIHVVSIETSNAKRYVLDIDIPYVMFRDLMLNGESVIFQINS